jgi:ABC-2 type transport system permease protein
MLRTVFAKGIFDSRRTMIGWSLGMAAAAGLVVGLYPVIRDSPEIVDLLESYPEALLELFGIDSIDTYTSPPGFLETQLFSVYVPLIFLIFAIGRGIAAIAGEEQDRTLDVLLANPVTRDRVVLEKAGAIAVLITGLGVVLFAVVWLGSLFFDDWPGAMDIIAGCTSAILLSILFSYLALAAGGVSGRRGLSLGVVSGITVAAYVIQGVAPLVDGLEWAERASPFFYYLDHNPLQNGFSLGNAAVLAGVAVLFLGVAVWGFRRRDIGVA